MVRRIFGPNREEVAGGGRRLHNEELRNLYVSPNIITVIKSKVRWAVHVGRMGEMTNAYNISVGRPERIRPLGRTRRRLEDNIRMDLREIRCEDVDWFKLWCRYL
jgi:hypothetical protein